MDAKESTVSFLESDFCQCFEQMRYYDAQIFDIFKYLSGYYAAALSLSVGLYQYSIEKHFNLDFAIGTGLIVSFLFGVFMYALIVRNRVYFVCVARYVNEVRKTSLEYKPLGFQNITKMYKNPIQPPYFNWRSSQSWLMCLVALLNGLLVGIGFYISCHFIKCALIFIILIIVLELLIGIRYLQIKEKGSVAKAVFGKDTEIKEGDDGQSILS